ncbi:MAG: endolytic transglycosylase MltG [Dermatophilaceae bacterium]|nr:endolytic transglycosylase MltG [Intrasporangiaceae bacterium]
MSSHLEDHIFGGDGDHDAPPDHVDDHGEAATGTRSESRPGRHTRPPRRDHHGSKASRFAVPLIALALLVGLAYGAYRVVEPMVTRALSSPVEDYPGPGSGEATVTVSPGESGADIARSLVDAGVIASTTAFVQASNADPSAAASIQPGDYTLLQEMKASDALAALNDPANRYLGERVTIREGLWKAEVFAALSEATGVPVEDYEAAAEDAEAIGLPEQAGGNVEGWLFPATYTLRTESSATEHLAVLVEEMKAQLTDAGVPEEDWQRTLSVASIVEGEARADVDLGKVAQVVENRLADPTGPTVGRLEMDSTVNYALQKRGNLTRTEFEEAKSHPYDTYVIQGLPPGPIGNPGRASIDAAANPTDGPWFFFVTVNLDTGETLFAETFAEHQANDRLRVQWCEDNPGKCTGGG